MSTGLDVDMWPPAGVSFGAWRTTSDGMSEVRTLLGRTTEGWFGGVERCPLNGEGMLSWDGPFTTPAFAEGVSMRLRAELLESID